MAEIDYKQYNKQIAIRFLSEIEKLGTVSQLAKAVNFPVHTFRNIKAQESPPDPVLVNKICSLYPSFNLYYVVTGDLVDLNTEIAAINELKESIKLKISALHGKK